MSIPLEDQFNDVLAKAIRGTGIAPMELAAASGVTLAQVRAAIEGAFDAAIVRAMAGPLGLAADRVVALGEGAYAPVPVDVDGLRQFNTPFDDMTVNAYLVWDPTTRAAAMFDTGSDVGDALAAAAEMSLRIEQIFITHSHGDHIYDLDRLREKTRAKAWTPRGEAVDGTETFTSGMAFTIGSLAVETRLTCGHSRGGVTYVVRGLARPVAICGDAMFAGSMGGGAVSYADALRTNRTEILSLPDETILAPGHGPLTTVGEQRAHNPFFPNHR